jgi:hypothetical protein
MKYKVKEKPKPEHSGVRHVKISLADNGGADVHVQHQAKEHEMYSPEKHSGSFSTKEEAMHHACGLMGANSELEEAGESPEVEGAEQAAPKKKK